jgi:predicted DsbA family dithiol-disulfide isomerase
MPYTSQVSFTLDTICPWTYLAKKRLSLALADFRSSHPNSAVTFTIRYLPYQLYPESSATGEDRFEWYKRSRYGDSEEKMRSYTTIMSAYGRQVDIDFKFGGIVANTLQAHRVIWWSQEQFGEDVAGKVVDCKQ